MKPLNSRLCFGSSVVPEARSLPRISICQWGLWFRIDNAIFRQWNHPSHCRPQGLRSLLLFFCSRFQGCWWLPDLESHSICLLSYSNSGCCLPSIGCFRQKDIWRLSSPVSLLYRLGNWGLEPWSDWLKVREDWELELGIQPEFLFSSLTLEHKPHSSGVTWPWDFGLCISCIVPGAQ